MQVIHEAPRIEIEWDQTQQSYKPRYRVIEIVQKSNAEIVTEATVAQED
jgi:hypothetical protein